MDSITIQFNGEPLEVPDRASIRQLLVAAKMRSQLVAVEVNRQIVPREQHGDYHVSAGDCVEAVTLVGGG